MGPIESRHALTWQTPVHREWGSITQGNCDHKEGVDLVT